MLMELWIFIQELFPYLFGMIHTPAYPQPLKKEEEAQMIIRMNQGDLKAREILIEHNLRLVVHIVKRFDIKNEMFEDYISIGTIGLIKAIDSFNPDKGHKLTTYASKCIENEILMALRSQKKQGSPLSLEDSIGFDKDGEAIRLMDIIPDKNQFNVIDEMTLKRNIKKLRSILKTLNSKERKIIEERYGINQEKEKTQKEIAQDEKISRSYVSRIEKRAFIKLLQAFKKEE